MTDGPRVPGVLRGAILSTAAGVAVSLVLLVEETPYTLAAFMLLGQPLLAVGWGLLAWEVFRGLRRRGRRVTK
jgi:hypothetical protein